MSGKSGQTFLKYLAAIAIASTATLTAIVPKVQAAVLTYNFDTRLFNGYFKINKIDQSKLDELAAIAAVNPFFDGMISQPIIEGKLFYKQTTYNYDTRETIEGDPTINPTFQNLVGEPNSFISYVSYYYGRFSQNQLHLDGLVSNGLNSQSWVNRVLPSDNYAGHIDKISFGLSWSLSSNVFGSTVLSYLRQSRERNGVRDYLLDRYYPPQADSINYELVSEDDFAQPVPEPIAVAGTALGLAGIAGLKHKKKRTDLSAKN
ncbi:MULTISPECIES: PEP-CTERM sorting domain-containing protein [unclassified Microcoleus]|uniref:PEP-CTERM sorting domain-containing protein n=1 Tax=unclassified Microcoleus TaxID=2642155 RepID=UPI0025F3103A|nr:MULTISPECIES: PEP-CTERM sorting domain-containing protein [unclassified Microcoleus]